MTASQLPLLPPPGAPCVWTVGPNPRGGLQLTCGADVTAISLDDERARFCQQHRQTAEGGPCYPNGFGSTKEHSA
jgi:hypothetical protein